jgi:hypothetical protein
VLLQPLYLGINSLKPFFRTDEPFNKIHFVEDTLYGCDFKGTAINLKLKTNLDILNNIDKKSWLPAYGEFMDEANALKGFVFTCQTKLRNVLKNTEVINLIHLKAYDCVTVMIHGKTSNNCGEDEDFDLVVKPDVKAANPCIVMWRNPEFNFNSIHPNSTIEEWRKAVMVAPFKDWKEACKDADVLAKIHDKMIFISTNLDGGSVSIVQNTIGRSITHIAVRHKSDYNPFFQTVGRAFHNQPGVKVMCLRHGADGATEEDRERYLIGKPIVRAFMSAGDIDDLKKYFHLSDEMSANQARFDTVSREEAMYTCPTSGFLRHNNVGLSVAKMSKRVSAYAELNVDAEKAQEQWAGFCPSHIKKAVTDEEHRQQKLNEMLPKANVTLKITGEEEARKPSKVVCDTDTDTVFRFNDVTTAMKEVKYEWKVTSPVVSSSKCGNGPGNHQPNNCPAHLAHMTGQSYKNIYVMDVVPGCVDIRVLKMDREDAKKMDGKAFTYTIFKMGEWKQAKHRPGGRCNSDACKNRARKQQHVQVSW